MIEWDMNAWPSFRESGHIEFLLKAWSIPATRSGISSISRLNTDGRLPNAPKKNIVAQLIQFY